MKRDTINDIINDTINDTIRNDLTPIENSLYQFILNNGILNIEKLSWDCESF